MKRMSLRLFCLLLVVAAVCTFGACTNKDEKSEDNLKTNTTPVPEITPEPAVADMTAVPATQVPAETHAAPTAEPTPEATAAPAEPITVKLYYNNAEVSELSFQTSTVFQLQSVASDGTIGGSWTSSDASIASVDLYGVVTCYKPGSAKITYTQGDATASCTLNITEPTVRIFFAGAEKNDITLKSAWGFEIDLKAVVTPDGSPVTWTSDDATVATVDENGHVSAKRMGTTTVHAKCGTADARCIVRVTENPPTYVAPTPDIDDGTPRLVIAYWGVANPDFTISVGQEVQMGYILYNVEGNPTVTWSIEDPNFASVDNTGKVTGLRPTKERSAYEPYTKLIATCGDLRCECIVRVKEAEKPI